MALSIAKPLIITANTAYNPFCTPKVIAPANVTIKSTINSDFPILKCKNLCNIFAKISVPPVDALQLNTIAKPDAEIIVPKIVASIRSLVAS